MAGRPPEAPGGRPVVMCVRLSQREAAAVDRMRRSLSRTQYLRWLVVKAIRAEQEQQ